jgi:hypothetical protein
MPLSESLSYLISTDFLSGLTGKFMEFVNQAYYG